MASQIGRVNKGYGGVNLVRIGRYRFTQSGLSFNLRLPVVANLGFDHDGPAIRLFDKNVRPTAFYESAPHIFGVDDPRAPQAL